MASTKTGPYSEMKLSVFFPAFNEEANIRRTVEKAEVVLEDLNLEDYEIIVVNDGSKDKTAEILNELMAKNQKLRVITHDPNRGYGEALKSGYYNSKFEWIAFSDGDGQFDFSEITKFLELTDKFDVVWGYRIDRQDKPIRIFLGWGWNLLSGLLLGFDVKDVDCGFRLVNKKVIDTIPHLESTRGGMVNPELLAKAKNAGFRIAEVGVKHYARTAGAQTGANLKVIFKSFVDLFKLWGKLK